MSNEEDKIKTALLADDLASLENYIHDLFNFSPLPICFVSPIGVLLEVNPSFESIAKLKSYELIGEPIEKLFSKEDVERLTKETLEEGAVKAKEMEFFPKDKEKIITQVFTRVRKDEKGDVVGYFLGLFDLTDMKKTGSELRKSQVALMNILDDTEDARRKAEEERNRTKEVINSLSDGLLLFDKDNTPSH